MLVKKSKYIISIVVLLLVGDYGNLFGQPSPPSGPPNGPAGPTCWPPVNCDVPINNELIILLIAGIGFTIYYNYQLKYKKEKI